MAEKTGSKALVNPLRDVEGDKCFWANNGAVIKNLYELHNSLETMDEATFNHHVNEGRNDFYNWVRDVIHDKKLANRLAKLKTRAEIAKSVKERVNELTVKQKKELPSKKKEEATVKKHATKTQARKIIEKAVKKKESEIEIPKTRIEMRDRPFTISGTLIALVTLFAVVGIINGSKAVITGAVTTDISGEVTPYIGVLIIVIASLAVVVIREIRNKR